MRKETKILVGIISLLIVGILFFLLNKPVAEVPTQVEEITSPVVPAQPTSTQSVIGMSVENRDIKTYTFGNGEENLLFVGGIHGGYEWNSVLLAYKMIEHFEENGHSVPENITVHIIPNLNPDGLFIATGLEGEFIATDVTSNHMHSTGEGRFNANNVDLNRNFDCKWAPESSWRGKTVSAGTGAFSEPEAMSLKNYVEKISPKAAVFWHSQANNVYASECDNGVLPETLTIMNAYSIAADYGAVPIFDAYPITGDAEGWLASIGIPAVTVELGSRTSIEWEQNLSGTNALLYMYGK